MFEFAALTYGVLTSFILSSVNRNRRGGVRNPPILNLFGWGMMSFSLAAAALIVGYAAYDALSGASVLVPSATLPAVA